MTDGERYEEEELHNELHNSSDTSDAKPIDQENAADNETESPGLSSHNIDEIDDEPEEQVEPDKYVVDLGSDQIYYFRDEEGELHSYDFLPEELACSADDLPKKHLERGARMKRIEADLDIVNIVTTEEEAEQGINIPAPKPGQGSDLRMHVSTEIGSSRYRIVTKRPEGWPKRSDDEMAEDSHPLFSHADDQEEPVSDSYALALRFTREQLEAYVGHRKQGLAPKSLDWINRASQAFWDCTHGEISEKTMADLRTFVLEKYSSVDSHRKALGFAVAFLKRLSTTKADPRFNSFEAYLELPKAVKVRKTITQRIVRRDDIAETLKRIDSAETAGEFKSSKARNYRAFVFLASYTGLRPSTIQRLTVGQFRTATKEENQTVL